jgi:spore coat protein U-like protein
MRSLRVLLYAALAAALPWPAWSACSVSAEPLTFGSYNPQSLLPADAQGNVRVSCTFLLGVLVTYSVRLSAGSSGTYVSRQMSGLSTSLHYNLYTDPTRLLVWGDGTGGTSTVNQASLLVVGTVAINHPVYGRIAAQQNVAPGNYSDTIVVTLEY